MKLFILNLCFVFTCTLSSQNLKNHLWKNRLLLVYANNLNSHELQEQIKIFESDKKGLKERKLLVYQFSKNSFKKGFYADWKYLNSKKPSYFLDENKFKVVLIGLDGTQKYKQEKIVSLQKIFALIDGMPMRKRAIQLNKQH